LSGSGERAAGFGGDLCVRRSLPAFSPCSEAIYQEESSAPFISRVRLVGTDERLLLKESTGNCATFPFQQISPPPPDGGNVLNWPRPGNFIQT